MESTTPIFVYWTSETGKEGDLVEWGRFVKDQGFSPAHEAEIAEVLDKHSAYRLLPLLDGDVGLLIIRADVTRAILTEDGYLFLESDDEHDVYTDGDMIVTIAELQADGIEYELIPDVAKRDDLAERVAEMYR